MLRATGPAVPAHAGRFLPRTHSTGALPTLAGTRVRALAAFLDRERKEVSFAMQLCSGGALTKLLARGGGLSEHEVATLTHKMLSAIHYCHQHGACARALCAATAEGVCMRAATARE